MRLSRAHAPFLPGSGKDLENGWRKKRTRGIVGRGEEGLKESVERRSSQVARGR